MNRRNMFTVAVVLVAAFAMMAAAQAFAVQKTTTNSIGIKFVWIPAGSFFMGSCMVMPKSDALREKNKKRAFLGQTPLGPPALPCPSGADMDPDASTNEAPQHKVRISKGFYMGAYEVTLGQFKTYIAETGRDSLLSDDFINANRHGDSCAVSYVSWDDAQAFVRWLNGKERGKKYRLPTEAEWEYACRAGTTTRFSFGEMLPTEAETFQFGVSAGDLGDYAWYEGNAKYAQTVGLKQPNAWGLYDMLGNVWEWCSDRFSDYNKYVETDPNGPNKDSYGSYRVERGGCWEDSPGHCRSARRGGNSPGNRSDSGGFRLVLLLGQ